MIHLPAPDAAADVNDVVITKQHEAQSIRQFKKAQQEQHLVCTQSAHAAESDGQQQYARHGGQVLQ